MSMTIVMNGMTKAEMQEIMDDQADQLEILSAKIEKVIAKEAKKSKKSTPKKTVARRTETIVFSDQWQLLTGVAFSGNQINLPPMPKANSKYSQNIIGKFAVPCTRAGLDLARAEIDIAENKLEKSGLLTS